MSEEKVAAEIGLNKRQIQKELRWMKDTGRIQRMEEQVLDLYPRALSVLQGALEKGDLKASMKVLDAVFKLGDRVEARLLKQEDRAQDTLADYLSKVDLEQVTEVEVLVPPSGESFITPQSPLPVEYEDGPDDSQD